jgi:AcrR family transcriptional regulator
MPRPPEPQRRVTTLAKATDYVLEHGLTGLSLRPLAAALDTSTRMLLYDFGSKEKLVSEVLAEVRRREKAAWAEHLDTADVSPDELLLVVWEWLIAPERTPYLRLFFQVYIDAAARPTEYPDGGRALVGDWLGFFGSPQRAKSLDETTATLLIGVVRGLLLDRLTAEDPSRVDRAMATFAAMFTKMVPR